MRARRVAGFLATLTLTPILALNGGGYDLVVRHEVSIVTWGLIAVGLAVGMLPRSRLTPAAWIALAGFGALALLTLLAHSWTGSDERTTAELARVLQYGGLVVFAYLTFNRHTWQGAAMGFAAGALLIPLFAVGARLFPDILSDDFTRSLNTDRLSFPLDYWNGVACWGAMATAVGLCLGSNAPRIALRSVALAAVPVAALSVYLTYSRFGVAAMAIALVAALALSRSRWTTLVNALAAAIASGVVILVVRGQDEIARATGDGGAGTVLLALVVAMLACAAAAAVSSGLGLDRLRMSRSSARIALAGGAVAALLAAGALNGPLERGWDQFRNDPALNASTAADPTDRLGTLGSKRYATWTTAIDAFQADSGRGIGPGTFEFYWSRHGDDPEFVRDAHSLYLEEAAELGILGTLALLAGLGGLLAASLSARRRWRRRRDLAAGSAMIAAFVVFLAYAAVDWMWELGAVGALAIGGVAVAGAGGFERAPRWKLGPWVRAIAVTGAVAAAATQVPALVSIERTRAADAALASGDLVGARELADDAIQAEPWAAFPYATRALISETAGDLPEAKADIEEAIEREPTNWRHPLLLARIDAQLGDRPGVREQLKAVRDLAPHSGYLLPSSPYRLGLNQLLDEEPPR